MERSKLIILVAIVVLAGLLVAFGKPQQQASSKNTLRIAEMGGPDSIDTGLSYLATSWEMNVYVGNGLLTYKKESGLAGNELVPDLATSMPKVSPDARVFTFTMRRGIKFAPPSNKEVLPSDMLATLERDAKMKSPVAIYLSGVLEGYAEYSDGKAKTISGVTIDDSARTIEFHLTRPYPTFLYVIAMPFLFVHPKGTPPTDLSGKLGAVGTGPYMYEKYDPVSGVELVRNPNFHQWTPDTPRGNVDRISIEYKVSQENAVTRMMQGSLDINASGIPRSKIAFIESSNEWKPYLHRYASSTTSYLFLNTTVPPFDNVKVRQALNYAIDRRALVKIGGGSGIPTSRILPVGMTGRDEQQPYLKADMAKARELIKESGVKAGTAVKVWCSNSPPTPDMAQYVQETLQQLGFEAKATCVDGSAYFAIVGNKSSKAQMGFAGWSADFPEGSNFLDVILNSRNITDPTNTQNLAWYSGMDKEISDAMLNTDLAERAKLWNQLDLDIMRRDAPWVPFANGVSRTLYSKRLGNVVRHPLYGTLWSLVTVDGSGTNNSKQHEGEVQPGGAS